MIEATNDWDWLCNLCILIMQNLSKMTGLSYGLVNILLFVILGPLSTLTSLVSAIIACAKGRNKISIILLIICILIISTIIATVFIAFNNFFGQIVFYEPAE